MTSTTASARSAGRHRVNAGRLVPPVVATKSTPLPSGRRRAQRRVLSLSLTGGVRASTRSPAPLRQHPSTTAPRPSRKDPTVPEQTAALQPVVDRVGLRVAAERHLRALAGEAAVLRADQWTAIEALVADRRRALVVQRTGWGKSAVYFIAAALLRAAGAGPTVIVSPLLALMRNQIEAADRAGIRAVTVNSTNAAQWDAVYAEISAGAVDVLLVSPERLNNPDFRDQVLPRLAATAGLLVIDEAHCISDWGHDFRPDYRRLRTLLTELPAGIPVLATPEHRLGWLADHLGELPGSGISYTLTVAGTVDVADYLRSRGYAVAAYSGQTDPADRLAAESDLLANRVKAVVATSALGMGFDKPDLGFVIHLGAPASPIAYYQQVGRAGRAVDRAEVVLLPGREDPEIWAYFASLSFPPEETVRRVLAALAASGDDPRSTAALETVVDLRRTRLEMMLKVLDVDGAVRRVQRGWVATGRPWVYDAERYARVAATRSAEADAMLDYIATNGCRMAFLRAALDDPAPGTCGRCDNCGGSAAPDGVDPATLAATAARLARPGVPVETRKLWPSGMAALGVPLSGKIGAGERAEPGRAIARLTDLGWGGALRAALAPGAPDAELAVPLRRAVVAVLDSWEFGTRPDAVVVLGSVTRPVLLGHLGAGLARYAGWPLVATLEPAVGSRPTSRAVNSAQRLVAVAGRFAVPAGVDLAGRTVLLVDDFTDSGWTLTVAARALRRAGAAAVYPLVLAVAS